MPPANQALVSPKFAKCSTGLRNSSSRPRASSYNDQTRPPSVGSTVARSTPFSSTYAGSSTSRSDRS